MKKCVSLFLAILFFGGCYDKEKRSFKKKYYPSGRLKSYGYYILDSVPVDTFHTQYESGKVLSIDIYDSIGNAIKSSFYYETGRKKEEINYKNGLTNGYAYFFAESGKLSQKIFYIDDFKVGDAFFYRNNTNILDRYGFYEWKERNINLITYDSLSGKPLKDLRQTIYLDSIRIETIKLQKEQIYSLDIILVISNPPNCRSTVIIDFISKDGNLIARDSVTGQPLYFAKKTFPDSLFAIKFSGSQYDSLTKESYEQWNKIMIPKTDSLAHSKSITK